MTGHDTLGTPLPPRRGFVGALAGMGVVFALVMATADGFWSTDPATLAMTVLSALFLVVIPLGGAWALSRLRLYVSADAVTSRLGRAGQSLPWSDVNRVEVRWAPGTGVMPRRRSVAVFTNAPGPGMRRIVATETQFDLRPLLVEVLAQCERRPQLLDTAEDRATLEEFASSYGLR